MATRPSNLIATRGMSACNSVHTMLIHHRDFPEIWAEGGTHLDAATHLLQVLSNGLGGSSSEWQREILVQAIDEVSEYISTQTRIRPGTTMEIVK